MTNAWPIRLSAATGATPIYLSDAPSATPLVFSLTSAGAWDGAATPVRIVDTPSNATPARILNAAPMFSLTDDWVAAVEGIGGTVSTMTRVRVNQFFFWEADGAIELTRDYFWYGAETEEQARVSLLQHAVTTLVGSPVFVPGQYYATNGTTSYLDTNTNALATGLAYTDLRMAIYDYARLINGGYSAGAINTSNSTFRMRTSSGSSVPGGNLMSAAISFTATPNSDGLWAMSRAGGGTTCYAYRNGVLHGTATAAAVGTALPNLDLYVGAQNNAGVASNHRAVNVGFYTIGSPVDAAAEALQYQNFRTWLQLR